MLSIGMFSKISKVTTKTLRYYDMIGLLKPVYINDENGYRYYQVEQLRTLLLIDKLKSYDFSLKEILEILESENKDDLLMSLLLQKQDSITKKITDYTTALLYLDIDIKNLKRGKNIMTYLDDIEVKLVDVEEKNIVSIRKSININDYGKYMTMLFEKIGVEKLTPVGAPMTIYHDSEFNPESYDLEIAVPVLEEVDGTRKLLAHLCAMVSYKGNYKNLTSVYPKMIEWINNEGYKLAGPSCEIYQTDPAQTAENENITEIYFPITK